MDMSNNIHSDRWRLGRLGLATSRRIGQVAMLAVLYTCSILKLRIDTRFILYTSARLACDVENLAADLVTSTCSCAKMVDLQPIVRQPRRAQHA